MSKKYWLCAVLASSGLLGCAAVPERLAPDCSFGVCKVTVTVADCRITLKPYDLTVPLPRGPKQIHWDIVSDDYMFATNGIVIRDMGQEFDQPDLSAGGKKFKWRDKHTGPGTYKYSVNVVKTGLNPENCPTYDPRIVNQ
jgi:hypothetical protein